MAIKNTSGLFVNIPQVLTSELFFLLPLSRLDMNLRSQDQESINFQLWYRNVAADITSDCSQSRIKLATFPRFKKNGQSFSFLPDRFLLRWSRLCRRRKSSTLTTSTRRTRGGSTLERRPVVDVIKLFSPSENPY